MRKSATFFLAGLMLAAGCASVIGLDDFTDAPTETDGGTSSNTGGTGAGTDGGGGVATTATEGGGSPDGGGGSGGGTFCEPNTTQSCYTGPAGTLGHGICAPGMETCSADGTEYGPCVGEVLPKATDDCATADDENCDGLPNDGCPCAPNSTQACYSGPSGTSGTGLCHGGTQTCNAQGTDWGPCVGEQTPQPETCATPGDDDCNGQTNEGGIGCVCTPNQVATCYSGPNGTENVGSCVSGMHTCNDQGTAWGPCIGEVTPQPETCNTPVDDDCNGQTNEGGAGCVCSPNGTQACYSGPGGTQGVGQCKAGTHVCNGQGTAWGACVGEVTPGTESCVGTVDEDCNGTACGVAVWAKIRSST